MTSWVRAIKSNLIYFLGGAAFLIVLSIAGYLLTPVFPVENLDTLLSVMIGSQASILAIVISVTLISTQLVATRYAPRMATLPFRTPLFKGTFALFVVSILLDTVLLLAIEIGRYSLYMAVLNRHTAMEFTVLQLA